MAAFLKSFVWHPVYGEKVEPHRKWYKEILLKLPQPLLGIHFFVHRDLKLVQLVITAHKHERFIEDLGDDVRVRLGFGFYLGPSYCFLTHMQSPVCGLASLLNEHKLDNTPRSPEAV